MMNWIKAFGIVALVAACYPTETKVEPPAPSPALSYPSSVELVIAQTVSSGQTYRRPQCSGVHIGDGYVLTAAHCTRNVDIRSLEVDGFPVFRGVKRNADMDYAIIQVPDLVGSAKSEIGCSPLYVGEELLLVSEPQGFDNIYTKAMVSSDMRPFAQWSHTHFVQGTGAPGSSGGPLYRVSDRTVAGILVGGFVPFGGMFIMVPSSVICGDMNDPE